MKLEAQPLRDAIEQRWQGTLELELFESLESTNRHLAQRVTTETAHSDILCVTEHQTNGVGRRGKTWHSPSRSVTFSIARRFDQSPATLMGLSLVAGLAVAEVLEAVAGSAIALKWPNDVLVDGKKLGGILIEIPRTNGASCSVVTGIGINIGSGPEHQAVDQPFISLQQLTEHSAIDVNNLTGLLAGQVLADYELFTSEGWPAFQARWAERDYLFGKPVTVHEGNQQTSHAIASGAAADGGLIVQENGISKTIYSADVSVRVNNLAD